MKATTVTLATNPTPTSNLTHLNLPLTSHLLYFLSINQSISTQPIHYPSNKFPQTPLTWYDLTWLCCYCDPLCGCCSSSLSSYLIFRLLILSSCSSRPQVLIFTHAPHFSSHLSIPILRSIRHIVSRPLIPSLPHLLTPTFNVNLYNIAAPHDHSSVLSIFRLPL